MVGRCSTAKVDFGLLTPNLPLFMNEKTPAALRTVIEAARSKRIPAPTAAHAGHAP